MSAPLTHSRDMGIGRLPRASPAHRTNWRVGPRKGSTRRSAGRLRVQRHGTGSTGSRSASPHHGSANGCVMLLVDGRLRWAQRCSRLALGQLIGGSRRQRGGNPTSPGREKEREGRARRGRENRSRAREREKQMARAKQMARRTNGKRRPGAGLMSGGRIPARGPTTARQVQRQVASMREMATAQTRTMATTEARPV